MLFYLMFKSSLKLISDHFIIKTGLTQVKKNTKPEKNEKHFYKLEN